MRSSSASRARSTSGLPNPGWSSYASRSTASPPTPSTAGAPSRTRRAAKRVASTPSTRPSSLPRRCVSWSGNGRRSGTIRSCQKGSTRSISGAIVGGKSGGPGEINAEAGPGSVPDGCALEYNIWYYPDQSLADVRAEFEARVLAACSSDWWLAATSASFHLGLARADQSPGRNRPRPSPRRRFTRQRASDRSGRHGDRDAGRLAPALVHDPGHSRRDLRPRQRCSGARCR